ncbi:hypothetical protein A33Q_3083 [Indibacter alkaliphilus LW1]|uniref:Tetratricopeptide repeat protein n=1 Tax=Indibacter alkaliphilus (strain CCUG 57479 / KCTC 22604 / LW1) TaxID=1189612 RepID=S2DUG1_INDAL|nr:APC family permease [Indibacter alkaliphilus]EOZ95721.1 hypothetical protein A33Q_3083 [Indibacter alkaliphilus LW1]
MPILPGLFTEATEIPLDYIQLGYELIPIEIDNFLLFQNFESLPPGLFPWVSITYGMIFWLLLNLGITLISGLKRMYFIGASALLIFLWTFSNINGLNIGGLSSNYALIGIICGTTIPLVLISFFAQNWGFRSRFALIFSISTISMTLLIYFSGIEQPVLWISENLSLPAAIIATLFLLHIGNAFITGVTVFLIKLNKGTSLKISWHILIVFSLYFLLVLFTLLDIMGEVSLPFPTLPPIILMLVSGVLGYYVLKLKLSQTANDFGNPFIAMSGYLLAFAITLWTWAMAGFSENQPLYEFFNHVFLYGQIALTLLFFIYLMSNFSQVLNSGTDVEKIIFKPQFFAYFHMKIGSIMALVILVVFADAIIAVQLSAASTNIHAQYYYQTGKPLQAAILYENSWEQFRRNKKAKNAAAHLRFQLNEPSLAMDNLYESFDMAPTVQNTLLISSRLHRMEKVFDAVFYLEKGLEFFPENPYLLNNLALLYSKLNRPVDAMAIMDRLSGKNKISQANAIALKVKHGLFYDEVEAESSDQIYRVNFLTYSNKRGDFAPFELDINNLPENFHLKTSILRNQWSNQVSTPLEKDLELMDTLIAAEQMSFEERNFKETRLLRTYQEGMVNESIKQLGGMAMSYPGSAGYYHALAAKVLVSQWDLEKAAIDILVSVEKGFENLQPYHLAVLYYGGKPVEAIGFQNNFELSFPDWMRWDGDGKLEPNDLTDFFDKVGRFHHSLPEQFIKDFRQIKDSTLKRQYGYAIMKHKIHWFSSSEFEKLLDELAKAMEGIFTEKDLISWFDFVHGNSNLTPDVSQELQEEKGLTRNAYNGPLIWKKYLESEDEMEKYELLQEAIQFNKDPKIWISFVKQSRKLGLDTYASSAISAMQGWLSTDQIEKLQMENL